MQNQVAAIAVVLALAVGAGLGYLGSTTGSVRTTELSTTTTTTISASTNKPEVCITNINSPPQSQYVSMLHQIIVTSSFIQYSNGRCWTWISTFETTGPGYSNLNFVFDHLTDQVIYLCGDIPAYNIDTRVYVVPSVSGGNVTSISIYPVPPPSVYSCPIFTATVEPVSFNLILWNSSDQIVSLKLQYYSFSNLSLQSLEARIYNSSWSYVMLFSDINSTHPLQAGASAMQEVLVPGAPLRGNTVYDVIATGTYTNGTQTISTFKVLLQT